MQEAAVMGMTNEEAMREQYLSFRVDDEDYGIEISYITEIIEMQEITSVPHSSHYVKGIINLRGTIVPIIDMRLRFGHMEIEYTDRTCIIVLSMDDIDIGIIVDEVQEVLNIPDDSIHLPPKTVDDALKHHFIRGIGRSGDAVKQLLNINRVFEVDD